MCRGERGYAPSWTYNAGFELNLDYQMALLLYSPSLRRCSEEFLLRAGKTLYLHTIGNTCHCCMLCVIKNKDYSHIFPPQYILILFNLI